MGADLSVFDVGELFDLIFTENGQASRRTGATHVKHNTRWIGRGRTRRRSAAWINCRQIKLDTPRGSRPHRFETIDARWGKGRAGEADFFLRLRLMLLMRQIGQLS